MIEIEVLEILPGLILEDSNGDAKTFSPMLFKYSRQFFFAQNYLERIIKLMRPIDVAAGLILSAVRLKVTLSTASW